MRRIAVLLTVMMVALALSTGAALAVVKIGDDGPNRLVGTAENDTLRGLGGPDVLVGRGNSDRLFGGSGRDLIDARDPGRPESDLVDCGPGFDTAIIDPDTEDRVAANCERVRVLD